MTFSGFNPDQRPSTPLPEAFFSSLLPQIDHLGELKLTLYCFWRLERMEGEVRYLSLSSLQGDEHLQALLGDCPLEEALPRAVARGSLLLAALPGEPPESYLFLNSPRGRAAAEAVAKGDWHPSAQGELPVEFSLERPNIFRLYEQHIGPLTPLLAESLAEAEQTYPAAWIEDAFREAVEYNKRSWRYIEAILRNWQEGGRRERQDRGDSEEDRRRYSRWDTSGKEK